MQFLDGLPKFDRDNEARRTITMVKERYESCTMEMSEGEYARMDMASIPKGRITKYW